MRTTRAGAAVVALLAATGLVISVVALWPRPPAPDLGAGGRGVESARPSGPVSSPSKQAEGGPTVSALPRPTAASTTGPPDAPARPVRVAIGPVDIDARVRPVGVAEDGQMQLPPDPRVFGWYRFGPAPGEPGSAVVAGHLDSRRFGLGPLVRLRATEVGDRVEVVMSDGSAASYRVRKVERFDRQGLPDAIFARTGRPVLRVVTCGGAYDPRAGGYQENLVVTAAPVR